MQSSLNLSLLDSLGSPFNKLVVHMRVEFQKPNRNLFGPSKSCNNF